jgi:hypothetical protein
LVAILLKFTWLIAFLLAEEKGVASDDEEDFYDAMSEQTDEFKISLPSSDKKLHQ